MNTRPGTGLERHSSCWGGVETKKKDRVVAGYCFLDERLHVTVTAGSGDDDVAVSGLRSRRTGAEQKLATAGESRAMAGRSIAVSSWGNRVRVAAVRGK